MTLKIYIIRHGEKTNDGQRLSELGSKQVRLLSKRLLKLNINKIYSSDLQRCKESTDIISEKLNLPIIYEKALREVPCKVKEFPIEYKNEIRAIKDFWNRLIKEDGNVLLVSSGIVNRILLSFALDINPSKCNLMQYPTGLTKIEKVGKEKFREWYKQFGKDKIPNIERFKIWHINDTSHIPGELKIEENYY